MGAAAAGISEPRGPETGISILRTGDDAARLRNRLERSANIGRYAMVTVGSITAAAGVATWITSPSDVGIGIAAFGGVLLVLGVVQHLLYRRDLHHWPTEVLLQDEGLELILPNGQVEGAMWSDPDFGLHLIARPAPEPAKREFLLIWLMDSRIPPVEISEEAFDRLREIAVNSGLRMSQRQRGSRTKPTQFVEIRQAPPESETARPSPASFDEPSQ